MKKQNKEYKKLWYEKNKEKLIQRSKEHYQNNKDKKIAYQKKWRELNREAHREYSKNWLKTHPEKAKERLEQWYKDNPEMRAIYSARRRTQRLNATPDWLSLEEQVRIKCLYQLSAMRNKESDIEWHVDHIVPLQGKNVCGLHVPWNLRVIPAKENMAKGNKYYD